MAKLIATLHFNSKAKANIRMLLRRKRRLEKFKIPKTYGVANRYYKDELRALKWVLDSLQDAAIVNDYYEFKKEKDY